MGQLSTGESAELSDDVRKVCACPVEWSTLPGFGDENPDALELLHREWIRCIDETAMSGEEAWLVTHTLLDSDMYELPDHHVLVNLRERRPEAEKLYMSGIGRMGLIDFLRPSEHGKHFAIGGPRSTGRKQSFFYKDLSSSTIASLFWSWFDNMMALNGDAHQYNDGSFVFLHHTESLWTRMRDGRSIRIAMDTTVPIGELNGCRIDHVAIDVDIQVGTAHAFPVTLEQAVVIMAGADVLTIKPKEY